jgi:signal transduction histidine kinase
MTTVRDVLAPDSRQVLRALMWTTAGVAFLFGPASMRHSARLADQQHHFVALWVAVSPWMLMAAATLFGTASQFEDAVFRRRIIWASVMALGFPVFGLILHYAWPKSRLPQTGTWSIWIVWWIARMFDFWPFNGAGPWTDTWTARWFGSPAASETAMRIREKEIRDAAMQEERNRLAQDLHDSIKQEIFAIHTSAATIGARLDTDPDGAREALERIRSSSRDAMTEMEALLDRLDATPLENTGLVSALRKQCDALALRTGASVECTIGELPESRLLPPGTHEALFRIAQEALSNIGKHARATSVRLTLQCAERDLQLTIEDNGQGFDKKHPSAEARHGMGLRNMQARSAAIGGRFEVTTSPGKGVALRVSVIVLAKTSFGLGTLPWWLGCLLILMVVLPVVLLVYVFSKSFESPLEALIFSVALLIFMVLPMVREYTRGRRPKDVLFR